MKNRLARWIGAFWQGMRSMSGDDAYERYVEHERFHQREPMDRRSFYVSEQHRRFSSGPTRCC